MSSQISQILSNFKLFSETSEPKNTISNNPPSSLKYHLTLVFLVVVIAALIYFKREEVGQLFAGIVGVDSINNMIGNLWLKTHLTSAGELASTYVPTNFSLLSAVEESALSASE